MTVSINTAEDFIGDLRDNAQRYLVSDDGGGAVWFPIVAEDMELPDP